MTLSTSDRDISELETIDTVLDETEDGEEATVEVPLYSFFTLQRTQYKN